MQRRCGTKLHRHQCRVFPLQVKATWPHGCQAASGSFVAGLSKSLSTSRVPDVRGIFFRAVALASLPESGLLATTAFTLPGSPECECCPVRRQGIGRLGFETVATLQGTDLPSHASDRASPGRHGSFSMRVARFKMSKQALPRPEFPASAAICDAGSDVATVSSWRVGAVSLKAVP